MAHLLNTKVWINLCFIDIFMTHICIQYFKTPLGELILGSYKDSLCLCDWRYRKNREVIDERITNAFQTAYVESESGVILESMRQLNDYFNKGRKQFDLPLQMVGSEFQKRVWNALINIPYGETVSYLELAKKLGNEKSIRAVASANGSNAISIIIPCHRVLGSKGELTGYAGGLETKRKLLQLESASLFPGQLQFF